MLPAAVSRLLADGFGQLAVLRDERSKRVVATLAVLVINIENNKRMPRGNSDVRIRMICPPLVNLGFVCRCVLESVGCNWLLALWPTREHWPAACCIFE